MLPGAFLPSFTSMPKSHRSFTQTHCESSARITTTQDPAFTRFTAHVLQFVAFTFRGRLACFFKIPASSIYQSRNILMCPFAANFCSHAPVQLACIQNHRRESVSELRRHDCDTRTGSRLTTCDANEASNNAKSFTAWASPRIWERPTHVRKTSPKSRRVLLDIITAS